MAVIGPTLAIALSALYATGGASLLWLARRLGRGDSALVGLPVIGGVVREMQELPYLESMHGLYGAGVTIVDAHRAATPTVKMQALRQQLLVAQALLEQGRPLHDALHTAAALSQETRALLKNGEAAGELEDALQRALVRRAQMAERRLESAARWLSAAAYGTAVIGVATIVVLFYTNYYAPIFEMIR